MTKKKYKALWQFPSYRKLVREKAAALQSDGCTGVIDFYRDGCLEHDIAYRTHRDTLGKPITKVEADKRLRWYIQINSIFGIFSPMSWWRWLVVRYLVKKAWNANVFRNFSKDNW